MVTERSTKPKIWAALKEAEAKLQALQEDSMNPTQIKEETHRQKVLEAVKDITAESAKQTIDKTLQTVQKYLANVSLEVGDSVNKFKDLNDAIEIKKQELDTVFEIDSAVVSLAAAIEAKKNVEDEFDQRMNMKREGWNREQNEYYESVKLEKEQTDLQKSRDKEKWEYDFDREKQLKMNELQDELTVIRRRHNEECSAEKRELNEREAALTDREDKVNDLEHQIDNFKVEIEEIKANTKTEIDAAVEESKSRIQKSHGIEKAASERKHEAEVSILNAKVENLQRQLQNAESQIEKLESKLEKSYENINAVSLQSLNFSRSSNDALVASMKSTTPADPNGKQARS